MTVDRSTTVVLREGVGLVRREDGTHLLTCPPHTEELGRLDQQGRRLLKTLAHGPADLDGLRSDHEVSAAASTGALLRRLLHLGWLLVDRYADGRHLYSVIPMAPHPERGGYPPPEAVASRFLSVSTDGERWLVASPRGHRRILLRDTALLRFLGGDDGDDPVGTRFRRDLWRAGLLTVKGGRESFPEVQWSSIELAFHEQNRHGPRTGGPPFGYTKWAHDGSPAPSPRTPRFSGPTVDLPPPGNDVRDPTLEEVTRARRSERRYDDESPMTIEQLGEFLHRAARTELVDGRVRAPYAAGGAAGELNVYLAVRRLRGLPAGMYRYDSYRHRLEVVERGGPVMEPMIAEASRASLDGEPPQLLLVISARFSRLMRSYQGMTYGLILKNVGCLYQSMYNVATAMGLAPCALGWGTGDLFARATGFDPAVEASVGEFMLGSRAKEVAP